MNRGHKQFFITYISDEYNRHIYNPETGDYGSYEHVAGNASTIRSAQSIISRVRKEESEKHPRCFRVFDSWDDSTKMAPVVYTAD